METKIKKRYFLLSGIIILIFGVLIAMAVVKNSEMLIQGEIETKTVDVSSKLTGRVKQINVQKGDMVKKGDVLILLDVPEIDAKVQQSDAALELARAKRLEVNNGARNEEIEMAFNTLNQAKTNLELAEKTYNRIKRLNDEGVVATQKLDEVTAQYHNAQNAVKIATEKYNMYKTGARYEDKMLAGANVKRAEGAQKEVLSYLSENKIVAPSDGQITELNVEEGELVSAGYPLAVVTDINDAWAVFNLREDLLSKIRYGTEFDVTMPAFKNKKMRVKVDYISVMGNFATWRATRARGDFDLKTFEVHAKPLSPNSDLRAGMSVIADWNKIKGE